VTDRRRPSRLLALLPFPIGRRDVLAIILGAAILGLVLFSAVKFHGWQGTNGSFGPDWECNSVGGGDAVCIKKPPKPPGTAAPANQPAAR
jgi:hypothetical protein